MYVREEDGNAQHTSERDSKAIKSELQ